jgi:hypothetical protein
MRYLLILLALTACTQRTPEEKVYQNKSSPHIFKDAPRLDMLTDAPMTYRVENDETICYIVEHAGTAIWCHWKTNGNIEN